MQRLALTLSLVLSVAGTFSCSSEGGDDGGEVTGGSGGSAAGGSGGSATGGTSGSATGGSTTGGSSGASTGGSTTGGSGGAGVAGGTGGSATGGSGGSAGAGFTKRGICGQKSEATVTATAYSGVEEFYMVSDENRQEGILDEYICLVRFDVMRVGEAPAGCADLDGVACEWTHKITFSNPTVVTNVDGACEKNEVNWNAAWMNGIDGTEESYGYVDMYEGHNSVALTAAGMAGAETWEVLGNASWDMTSGDFEFDNRLGECRY